MNGVTSSTNERFVGPDLAEFLARRMRDISARINCHTVGTIQSFDPVTQTATVSVNFKKVIKGVNPLNSVAEASDMVINYPTLVNVPVIIMQGGGAYLSFPIKAGDTCMVLFCDRDMDIWFATGQVAPPNSERVHDINDAVAIVGIRNMQNPIADYNPNIASLVDRTGERLAQSGDLKATARSTAPSGWLLCYGQSLAAATYPDLFEAIGYTYGGSGASFNVPDLRGRIPVGLDNMGGSNANVLTNAFNPNRDTLGGAIGEEAHLLTGPESGIQHHDHFIHTTGVGAGPDGTFAGTNDGTYDPVGTTGVTGNTDAEEEHQNVQPGRMFNWVIKI